MIVKIEAAIAARKTDLVLVGRTDAVHTHGVAEGIRRGNRYAEAGCDMIEVFPNTLDEAAIVAREVQAPLVYVNSAGNRKGRPVLAWAQLEDMGYKLCIDSTTVMISAVRAIRQSLSTYLATGHPPAEIASDRDTRSYIESTIGLDELYDIESRTLGLERGPAAA